MSPEEIHHTEPENVIRAPLLEEWQKAQERFSRENLDLSDTNVLRIANMFIRYCAECNATFDGDETVEYEKQFAARPIEDLSYLLVANATSDPKTDKIRATHLLHNPGFYYALSIYLRHTINQNMLRKPKKRETTKAPEVPEEQVRRKIQEIKEVVDKINPIAGVSTGLIDQYKNMPRADLVRIIMSSSEEDWIEGPQAFAEIIRVLESK